MTPIMFFQRSIIRSIDWSLDGGKIAIASDSGVTVLDAINGQIVFDYSPPQSFSAAKWHPNNDILLAGSDDGFVHLWNITAGQRIATYNHSAEGDSVSHFTAVYTVAWYPAGNTFVSAGGSGVIKVWDSNTGNLITTMLRSRYLCTTWVSWSPDSTYVASTHFGGAVQIWNGQDFTPELVFPGNGGNTNTDYVSDVIKGSWSPDGTKLATIAYEQSPLIPKDGYSGTEFHLNPVRVWSLETNQAVLTIQEGVGALNQLAWSPDGTRIATGNESGTVAIWNATYGQQLQAWQIDGVATALTWSPDSSRLTYAASNEQGSKLQIVQPTHPASPASIP